MVKNHPVLQFVKLHCRHSLSQYSPDSTLLLCCRSPFCDPTSDIDVICPDVKSDNPRCSASQKLAEGSLQYTVSDLGPSYVSVPLLEKLYYYVLRNAHHNLILRQNMLHKYLIGSLISPSLEQIAGCWQFTNFFPLNLHKQIWYPESFRIVKGIVVIDNPVISYVEDEDLEKFKSLSGLYDIKIDMDEFLHYKHEYSDDKDIQRNCVDDNEEANAGQTSNGNHNEKHCHKYKRRCQYEPPPTPQFPQFSPVTKHYKKGGGFQRTCQPDGPAIVSRASIPNEEERIMDASIILSGTARKGIIGPPVGVVDIGVCRVAYYFRVALPGVRKDYSGKFSCEIECDGKVYLRGFTNGGQIIKKPSRTFKMKFQQICLPGPFTLSFSLPGPVDPRLFAPNFRPDGIFEGVVIKDQ